MLITFSVLLYILSQRITDEIQSQLLLTGADQTIFTQWKNLINILSRIKEYTYDLNGLDN